MVISDLDLDLEEEEGGGGGEEERARRNLFHMVSIGFQKSVTGVRLIKRFSFICDSFHNKFD